MIKAHFVHMARYNKWAYNVLFDKIHLLSSDEYGQQEQVFSYSIHGTLTHLLLAENLWFSRIVQSEAHELSQLYPDVNVNELWKLGASNGGLHWHQVFACDKQLMQAKILNQCDLWIEYLETLSDSDFGNNFVYKDTKGTEYSRRLCDALTHVFNHGTHHRGQISCLVMQHLGGGQAPEMDFLYFLKTE